MTPRKLPGIVPVRARAIVAGYDVWCDEHSAVDGGFSYIKDARAAAKKHNQEFHARKRLSAGPPEGAP